MKTGDSQRKALGDWKQGRALSAMNLQEVIEVVRDLQNTIITPQQVTAQTPGIPLYRVTEVVDLTLEPVTWEIKTVRVNDVLNTEDPPALEAISDELTMKLQEGTYGIAIGDLVTKATGKKDPYSNLVVPVAKIDPDVYKVTADEAGGEITVQPMKLDLSVIGNEETVKVFPDA